VSFIILYSVYSAENCQN